MTILSLARKNIQQLTAYQSAGRIGRMGEIWLNANEAPTSPALSLPDANWNRYAEDQPVALLEAYANYCGLQPEQLLVCRGADEGIDILVRTFCDPLQDSVIYCPPTYDMYAVYSAICAVNSKPIPTLSGWQLDLPTITANLNQCKLIYLCNPNNPTGSLFAADDIRQLLQLTAGKTLVVMDEAYIEFCPENSVVQWLNDYPHLVILRTLSKAFALAGLHCGFVLANEEVISLLAKTLAPYPIPTPVSLLAIQALTPANIITMQHRVASIVDQRQQLQNALLHYSCIETVFNSNNNFLLVKWKNATAVDQFLLERGISLRSQQHHQGLENCLRITIGTQQECRQLLNALDDFEQSTLKSR